MNLDLSQLNQTEVIAMAVAGLLLLFAGYKIKKIAFFIIWFLIGVNLMNLLMPEINKLAPDIVGNDLWQNLLPIAGGLLLALLGFSIEKLCVGGICFALVMIVTAQYFGTEMQTMLIGAVIGVVAAGLAVALMKPAIIIATALAGAYTLTVGVLYFAASIDGATFYFPILIGLTAIGSGVQFATTKGE